MNDFSCPLCGQNGGCKSDMDGKNGYQSFHCDTFKFDYMLSDSVVDMPDEDQKEQLLNLVVEYLLQKRSHNTEKDDPIIYHFFYDTSEQRLENTRFDHINLADLLKTYPSSAMNMALRTLMNLSVLFPNYGSPFSLSPCKNRAAFDIIKRNTFGYHNPGILEILGDLGYLNNPESIHDYQITAKGWMKIDELRTKNSLSKQAFIAMKFEGTETIREAFRKAITESGFTAQIIDEKEHNNQIVPEIFYEIERSLFMVVDVTYPCEGAYYEAGYGQALGKEVIVCCRKDVFDEKGTHFDIAQKCTVVWENEKDLINRLKKRIEATIHP